MRFNAAVYDEEWNKFQFSFLGLNSLTVVENGPKAQIRGVEASLDWTPIEHLTLSGGGAYNDAKLAQNFCGADPVTGAIIPTCATSASVAPKDAQLPYTPKVKTDVTARYTFGFYGWDAHAQAAATYSSRTQVGLRSEDVQYLGAMPGYTSVDLALGGQRDNLTVELFVKNLFDKRGEQNRYTPCTVNICAASNPGLPTAVYVIPIQPMTIGLRFGQKF